MSGDGGFDRLRTAALIAAVVGAVGSEALMLLGGHPPFFLRILFTFWVLSPFAGLVLALKASPGWPALTRTALYGVTLVVTMGSLAIYLIRILRPTASTGAFWFVLVPPASFMLATIVVAIAAMTSRRRRGA